MGRYPYFVVPIFFWIVLSCEGTNSDRLQKPIQADCQSMKEEMVETQIRARGISDGAVLNAMLKVDRHRFVPEEMHHLAYSDRPLPIGEGQTISQPYIVALMTELLELKKGDKVITAGGIFGSIESVSEDSILIKVESGATMRVAKNSVAVKRD